MRCTGAMYLSRAVLYLGEGSAAGGLRVAVFGRRSVEVGFAESTAGGRRNHSGAASSTGDAVRRPIGRFVRRYAHESGLHAPCACVLANHVDQDLTNWGCLTRSGLSEIGNFIDALIAAGD